jgi:hypothetical protein
MEGAKLAWRTRSVKLQQVNWLPWSEWITVLVVGVRLVSAMDRALVTSEEAWWVSIDQPTTLLEWASSTTQQ